MFLSSVRVHVFTSKLIELWKVGGTLNVVAMLHTLFHIFIFWSCDHVIFLPHNILLCFIMAE